MKIAIVFDLAVIPAVKYGGSERVIWYLGKKLVEMGHQVVYMAKKGSFCPFAEVIEIDPMRTINDQIPEDVDIVHINSPVEGGVEKPFIMTHHGNILDAPNSVNSVFVSRKHAENFNSTAFVYNGLDWHDYGRVELNNKRDYFHFLGKASWKVKNLKGTIRIISATQSEKLKVLGGSAFKSKVGLKYILNRRVSFEGMVGGERKNELLQGSKGLIFPVLWEEPMGLAIIESLYFGAPAFGTTYGSLPEIINERVGFLSNSESELSRAIVNAGDFSPKVCHEYARDVFNSEVMAKKYLSYYEKVLNGEQLNANAPEPKYKGKERYKMYGTMK